MYIGIDLGGTNIAAGIVDKEGRIIFKDSVPTKAEIMPKNMLDINSSPHLASLDLMDTMPDWIFFRPKSTTKMPGMMPSVITHAMALYA